MKPTEEYILSVLKSVQSRLCEHCPQYISEEEQIGDHTDECLEAMELIEEMEKRISLMLKR